MTDIIEILLVEDNPSDQELTLKALKKYNLSNNIYIVEDGAEALDFIFAEGEYSSRNINMVPRLILLDLKLPKVSGLEVLKIIKSDVRTKKIPVVVLTSSKEERDIVESYEYGVNSYIVKPVDFSKFVESIKEVGFYWLLLNQVTNLL
ncbi:MAG: response regulator [Ignavibacteriaceae bacterium]|nr:response regulator [Ignavibacteriaceae bacterium]